MAGLFIRDDADIKNAVNEWCLNPKTAESKYGDISEWDTSAVTSMKELLMIKKNSIRISPNGMCLM